MKFSDWFWKWYETYRMNKLQQVTQKKYETWHEQISKDDFGEMPLKKITRKDVQDYVSRYGKDRSKSTVNTLSAILKACFQDAEIDGLIKKSPYQRIEVEYKEKHYSVEQLKEKREEKKSLDLNEYERLKGFLLVWLNNFLKKPPVTFDSKNHNSNRAMQFDMMIIFVALKSGCRFSEILGITEIDYDKEMQEISINKTWNYKTAAGGFLPTKNIASVRTVLVDQETTEMFERFIGWKNTTYSESDKDIPIFIEPNKRMFNDYINKTLRYVLKSLGIENISFHKLRHTHASILVAKKVPDQVVAKRLGHTDTNMIRKTYGHLLKEVEDAANEMIRELI
ncbi:site-specific integrase [Enterococcus raffinosus]|uniref:tyrosine-type recombinase/integrase n=1 Tax=Enterococcus raffinosus TaxID=71452 RepID=UPI0028922F1A|nr:site-specific integrase [Enterococcus raffinosus]MDT2570278.1 site-specific integrase [Enterococcus raffinosus]